jgi:hypothetical protein
MRHDRVQPHGSAEERLLHQLVGQNPGDRMTYAILVAASMIFVEACKNLKPFADIRQIVDLTGSAIKALSNKDFDDDEKERIARHASLGIFASSAKFLVKIALPLAVLSALFAIATLAWPNHSSSMLNVATEPRGLALMTVSGLIYWRLRR